MVLTASGMEPEIKLSISIRTHAEFNAFLAKQTEEWWQAFNDAMLYAMTWGMQNEKTDRDIYVTDNGTICLTYKGSHPFYMEGGVDPTAKSGFRFHS